jgi:alkyl hydroperoxide reductase subunit AhpC
MHRHVTKRFLAWTGVCRLQMEDLEEHQADYEERGAVALGMSVDTAPSKKAWAEDMGVENTLLRSDFWPHGEVAKKYGVFDEELWLARPLQMFHGTIEGNELLELRFIVKAAFTRTEGFGHLEAKAGRHLDVCSLAGPGRAPGHDGFRGQSHTHYRSIRSR